MTVQSLNEQVERMQSRAQKGWNTAAQVWVSAL